MATKIIIDGYNFLWNDDFSREKAIRGIEKGREQVIAWCQSQPLLNHFEVVIIFDAYKTDATHPTEETKGNLRVVYTSHGQRADDLMKEMASFYGTAAILISSDKEVMRFAERKDCGVLNSLEFQRIIQNPHFFERDPAHQWPKAKRKALAKLTRVFS